MLTRAAHDPPGESPAGREGYRTGPWGRRLPRGPDRPGTDARPPEQRSNCGPKFCEMKLVTLWVETCHGAESHGLLAKPRLAGAARCAAPAARECLPLLLACQRAATGHRPLATGAAAACCCPGRRCRQKSLCPRPCPRVAGRGLRAAPFLLGRRGHRYSTLLRRVCAQQRPRALATGTHAGCPGQRLQLGSAAHAHGRPICSHTQATHQRSAMVACVAAPSCCAMGRRHRGGRSSSCAAVRVPARLRHRASI